MKLMNPSKVGEQSASFIALSFVLLFAFFTPSTLMGGSDSLSDSHFIEGFDLVSYFRKTGPVKGSSDFSMRYDEHTLLFANKKNLIDFQENPTTYMPAYNGNCAYGMVFGMKSKVDPLQYNIIDGKLYLLLDEGTKKRFNRRLDRNLKKSQRAWQKLFASSDIKSEIR